MIISQYHQIKMLERDAEAAEKFKNLVSPIKPLTQPMVVESIENKLDEFEPEIPLNKILVDVEIYCLTRALNLAKTKAGAARILGLNRTTLVEKLKKWCVTSDAQDIEDFVSEDFDFDPSNVNFLMELKWLTL